VQQALDAFAKVTSSAREVGRPREKKTQKVKWKGSLGSSATFPEIAGPSLDDLVCERKKVGRDGEADRFCGNSRAEGSLAILAAT
jgi:hypothetical protein